MCKILNEKICHMHTVEEILTIYVVEWIKGFTKGAMKKLSGVTIRTHCCIDLQLSITEVATKGSQEQINGAKQLTKMLNMVMTFCHSRMY